MEVPPDAQEYLTEHPSLIPLLLQLEEKIPSYFGASAWIRLELVTFPEAQNDQELFALVNSELPLTEARERLEYFDEEWWVDARSEADCTMSVDIVA